MVGCDEGWAGDGVSRGPLVSVQSGCVRLVQYRCNACPSSEPQSSRFMAGQTTPRVHSRPRAPSHYPPPLPPFAPSSQPVASPQHPPQTLSRITTYPSSPAHVPSPAASTARGSTGPAPRPGRTGGTSRRPRGGRSGGRCRTWCKRVVEVGCEWSENEVGVGSGCLSGVVRTARAARRGGRFSEAGVGSAEADFAERGRRGARVVASTCAPSVRQVCTVGSPGKTRI